MISITGTKEMNRLDQETIKEAGISGETLMERAALAAAVRIEEKASENAGILVVCGMGNNGGDGIALARILHLHGLHASVLMVGNPHHRTESNRRQEETARYYQVPFVSEEDIEKADILVDAIFGVGLSRAITEPYEGLLRRMNASSAWKLSLDIPSGVNGDTGAVMGSAFCADETVTFAYRKKGICLYPGRKAAGKVITADIGIYGASGDALAIEEGDLLNYPRRQASGNKGTFGKVLILAGNESMCGAAYLSAAACLRMGVGMVQIHTSEQNRIPLQTLLPEALIATDSTLNTAERLYEWCDALILGPGLGTSIRSEELLSFYLKRAFQDGKPAVVDADGLNLFTKAPTLKDYAEPHLVFTPHMGEMSRLTGISAAELKQDPEKYLRDYTQAMPVTCVMKDAATIIGASDSPVYYNLSGNDGLATAGSGDVLSGILGGILCLSHKAGETPEGSPGNSDLFPKKDNFGNTVYLAALGVYFHGLLSERAAARCGRGSLTARDLIDEIPGMIKKIEDLQEAVNE